MNTNGKTEKRAEIDWKKYSQENNFMELNFYSSGVCT